MAVQRCWERLKWLVETAGIEPAAGEGATLGLGPELALELLRGLLREAQELGDDSLANAVTVYQNQFGLVLAQQGGPLSELGATASSSGDGRAGRRRGQPTTEEKPKGSLRGRQRRRATKQREIAPNWPPAQGGAGHDDNAPAHRGPRR